MRCAFISSVSTASNSPRALLRSAYRLSWRGFWAAWQFGEHQKNQGSHSFRAVVKVTSPAPVCVRMSRIHDAVKLLSREIVGRHALLFLLVLVWVRWPRRLFKLSGFGFRLLPDARLCAGAKKFVIFAGSWEYPESTLGSGIVALRCRRGAGMFGSGGCRRTASFSLLWERCCPAENPRLAKRLYKPKCDSV